MSRTKKKTLVLKVVTTTFASLYAKGHLCSHYEVGSTHTAPKELPLFVYTDLTNTYPGEMNVGRTLLLCEATGKLVRIEERLDLGLLYSCKTARKALRLLREGKDTRGVDSGTIRGATQLRVVGVVARERSTRETLVLTDGREFSTSEVTK